MSARPIPLIVLAAGGTAGHVFPAEALGRELLGRGCRVALVTDSRGTALGDFLAGGETHTIRAGGLAGKGVAARLRGGAELALGMWQARRLLGRLKPSVVVGFGGYASVPTMVAASLAGCRTAIHEQNAVLGRANRLLASRVSRIATSFEGCRAIPERSADRVVHTGMPVRAAIAAMRERPYMPPSGDGTIRLMVVGGSQGARIFSQVVPEAVTLLPEGLRCRLDIVQQCRPEDLAAANAIYQAHGITAELKSFFDDIPDRLAAAHLIIVRSGASTVAEALAVGRPAILVPYPHAIDDHQSFNAHAVAEAGGGWLMPQDGFTAPALAARLESLLGVPATLERAAAAARTVGRPDAATRLADMVMDLMQAAGDGRPPRRDE
ncbi:MAG: undecaprenyldiphospho-muramoylpentapeptide beta-N-acetylglucosaminyltransferase [Rhodospirillales bacterium]|jgi:UDP-N-acetylglucosamine--N-acetylmuramyl-(pentapeptide) pyrophosphoryl-undecaprenol N-acetylglucosamine transferase|nr:undecaprenyldiphospho-muramoylpentapeptide beta-N-acetylglucosaminyltransferase [Rhodospirillales bacterium]